MLNRISQHGAVAMVVALALLYAIPAGAAKKPTGAQLGPVWIGGGLTSGATLTYQLNLIVTSPGTLTSKAKLKGKGLKATFPDLTATPILGAPVVESAPLTIPSTFTGQAKLRVKVYYNGKRVGAVNLLLTIIAPPAIPPVPVTTFYDVGFSSNVVVNADAVSTNGFVGALTYAWSITDTDVRTNATFSDVTATMPRFNTLPITTFPVRLIPDDAERATGPVGIDTDQVNMSTYHLRVIVTDSLANSKTGNVTVISASTSPAQQSIPVGVRQYYTRTVTNTYSWSLVAKPANSTAVLENLTSRTPSLRPDVEGQYTIRDARSTEQFTVKAAKFVGSQTCAECHGPNSPVGNKDVLTPWSQTGHATFFQRAVDGLVSDYYNESCIACHTVGHNKAPLANNDGFDDVQAALDWKFPTVKQFGNYLTVPAALQSRSNIGCESCHGPGSQHPGPASTSLNVAVCATCHQDGHFHTKVEQWERSPHSEPFFLVSEEEGVNPSCAKCHSTAGFVDYSKGKSPIRAEANMLSCQGCHDPHNAKGYPAQVRFYDEVFIDDSVATPGFTLTGQGVSATCMSCHHARRSMPPTHDPRTTAPHESTATDVLLGIRPSTNVTVVVAGATNLIASVKLENSAHTGVAKCVDCHMHSNPAIGQPGHNLMGDHTFSVRNVDTHDGNLAACQKCHAGVDDVTSLDHISVVRSGFPNAGDYDGNGVTEGVQTETANVLAHLEDKLRETGVTTFGRLANYTPPNSPTNLVRAVQRNAVWNHWLIARDLSQGVHNTAFTIRLLQWSYTVLSTNTGGNAYEVDFPNADLR